MKSQLTFGQLLQIDQDLNQFQLDHPGLAFILRDKLENFYKQFSGPLRALPRKHQELLKKHTILDEKGEPKFIEKEDKSIEYIWATPSSNKVFEEESKNFLERPVMFFK